MLYKPEITADVVRAPGKGVHWSQRPVAAAAQALLSTQDKADTVAPSSLSLRLSSHPLPCDLLLARQRPAVASLLEIAFSPFQCNCGSHISCPGSLKLTFGLRSEFEDNGLVMGHVCGHAGTIFRGRLLNKESQTKICKLFQFTFVIKGVNKCPKFCW